LLWGRHMQRVLALIAMVPLSGCALYLTDGDGPGPCRDGCGQPEPLPPTPCESGGCTEPVGCYTDEYCGEETVCNAQEVCLPDPNCTPAEACDPACWGYCVPLEPDVGSCFGESLCDVPAPECPNGSAPGIRSQCYTGFCIPLQSCESAPACASLATEPACIARPDCRPTYEGIDCKCDPSGCDCKERRFLACS